MRVSASALLLAGFSLGILTGCDKDDEIVLDDFDVLYWANTQCADPWDQTQDATPAEAIALYLQGEELSAAEIVVDPSQAAEVFCAACDCTDGTVYEVSFKTSDTERALALGFERDRPEL